MSENQKEKNNNKYNLSLPSKAHLSQNQPNPFNQETIINYFIPQGIKNAYIQITTLDGKVQDKLTISKNGTGALTIKTNAYQVGNYFYSLILDGQLVETKKMMITK